MKRKTIIHPSENPSNLDISLYLSGLLTIVLLIYALFETILENAPWLILGH